MSFEDKSFSPLHFGNTAWEPAAVPNIVITRNANTAFQDLQPRNTNTACVSSVTVDEDAAPSPFRFTVNLEHPDLPEMNRLMLINKIEAFLEENPYSIDFNIKSQIVGDRLFVQVPLHLLPKTGGFEFSVVEDQKVKARYVHVTGSHKKLRKYGKRIGKRAPIKFALWAGRKMVTDIVLYR